jgi:hypothetical protein
MFTRFVSLRVYGLNLMSIMVWAIVVVSGTSLGITIKLGIAIE